MTLAAFVDLETLAASIAEKLKDQLFQVKDVPQRFGIGVAEAAELSGFSEGRIRAAIRSEKLRHIKDGPRYVIDPTDLRDWLEAQKEGGRR